MKLAIENVRVSTKGKEILIRAKRKTGLTQWNELCRVALCRSISNPKPVKLGQNFGESGVEMDWKTFARPHEDVYLSLILLRAREEGIDIKSNEAIVDFFRAHLERGITTLNRIEGLEAILNPNPEWSS